MPPGPLGSTWRGSCCALSPPPCRSWRRMRPLPRRSLPSSWGRGRRRRRSRQWGLCGRGPATPWQHGGRRIPGAEASSDAWEPPALTPVVYCPLGAVLGLAYTCRPGGPPGRPGREVVHGSGQRGAHARPARARGGPGPLPFSPYGRGGDASGQSASPLPSPSDFPFPGGGLRPLTGPFRFPPASRGWPPAAHGPPPPPRVLFSGRARLLDF